MLSGSLPESTADWRPWRSDPVSELLTTGMIVERAELAASEPRRGRGVQVGGVGAVLERGDEHGGGVGAT